MIRGNNTLVKEMKELFLVLTLSPHKTVNGSPKNHKISLNEVQYHKGSNVIQNHDNHLSYMKNVFLQFSKRFKRLRVPEWVTLLRLLFGV